MIRRSTLILASILCFSGSNWSFSKPLSEKHHSGSIYPEYMVRDSFFPLNKHSGLMYPQVKYSGTINPESTYSGPIYLEDEHTGSICSTNNFYPDNISVRFKNLYSLLCKDESYTDSTRMDLNTLDYGTPQENTDQEFGVEMKREKNEKRQEEKKDEEELSMTIERIKKRMDTLGEQPFLFLRSSLVDSPGTRF
ncbi:uncharacterized protein LOC111712581 [Eurytemora carolleeae]|uniref:uncharacterized protein LOC111712581 n=1 Tax=Eurytemora carolleeae TaxID=1294199 RepID=UPI000C76D7DF|nr:uncharacterized protein LOC111712581 [Eurytemora carolleeae]|eukprot:XP_023343004.1 uncharacterized protein LOC111712581 [Eurytemora affinis]